MESLSNEVAGLEAHVEKYLRTAASDSSYILHKKLTKIIQGPD